MNLVLLIVLLFLLVGIVAMTAVVHYAGDEIEELQSTKKVDTSLFEHNLFEFLTLMPAILICLQVLINVLLILQESQDEIFFYVRENCQGIAILKGVFGLSLALLTGMLGFKLYKANDSGTEPAGSDVAADAAAHTI